MKHLLLVALALLALAPPAQAQTTDHNSKSWLKGVKKIYIDAEDPQDYERILDALKEDGTKLIGVVVVNHISKAEVVLQYWVSISRYSRGVTQSMENGRAPSTGPSYDPSSATGLVWEVDKLGGRRKLLTYEGYNGLRTGESAAKFAKAFVKAWLKANPPPPDSKPGS